MKRKVISMLLLVTMCATCCMGCNAISCESNVNESESGLEMNISEHEQGVDVESDVLESDEGVASTGDDVFVE